MAQKPSMKNPCSRRRISDPFDDSVIERQKRMGLLFENGEVNNTAITIISRVQSGLFWDNLSDNFTEICKVKSACDSIIQTAKNFDTRRTLLELCSWYDTIRRPLPETIWWIVGNDDLLAPFIEGFVICLSEILERLEVEKI